MERSLIVNADDFGLTSGINRGIIEAHERGVVTSASLMVAGAAAEEAADYCRAQGGLSVGLHLDLGEWRYRDGEWRLHNGRIDVGDAEAVRREIEHQVQLFEKLTGRSPTHLDSHQHAHLNEPVQTVTLDVFANRGLPVRSCTASLRYYGSFYGQTGEGEPYPDGISLDALVNVVADLPQGWTELGCHPGYAYELDSVYLQEREAELRVLCHPAVREALQRHEVRLRSFTDWRPSR